MKVVELEPIKESTEDYEAIERKIIELFKREVYFPLLKELGLKQKILRNSKSSLIDQLTYGRITFYRGTFSGRFSASSSKELKALGAQWDRKTRTWKIPQSSLPIDVRNAISASEAKFQKKISGIDQRLSKILPEEIAERLHVVPQFDASLWKVEKEFSKSVKKISVTPQLSDDQRRKVSEEWQENMRLWIKDFTAKEITQLRKDVQASVFTGNRYESMVKTIQKSYGVTENKAKFLARQETSLLMAKYKETRYVAAGVKDYKWGCVKMPHQTKGAPYKPGDVRYGHGILEGKTFSWDAPPIVNDKGERKNPGQDYNCRCFAIPIVKF